MRQHKNIRLMLTIFLILQAYFTCFSQIVFSKGYIINNQGNKIECLIKNYDWKTSPSKIQYKLNESAANITGGIDSIKEFVIDDFSRYVRASVKIDRSSPNVNSLSTQKKPQWSDETLFLKELVCGKAGLWEYSDPDRSWFFYSIDNSLPIQLIYKEYLYDNDKIIENTTYLQQIVGYLQNENTKSAKINTIRYSESSLIKYFKLYNSTSEYCVRTDFNNRVRELFNVKITGSINKSKSEIQNKMLTNGIFNFDDKINWMTGLELEYFLPFNRNAWSLLIAPTYEQINFSKEIYGSTKILNIQSITFPVGARYTKYLNNDTKFFIDVYFNSLLCLEFNNHFNYSNYTTLPANEGSSMIIGGGFAYKNFGLELKYHFNRPLLVDYVSWNSKYTKVSLTVSYKLCSIKGK